jgi:hypothetical protein
VQKNTPHSLWFFFRPESDNENDKERPSSFGVKSAFQVKLTIPMSSNDKSSYHFLAFVSMQSHYIWVFVPEDRTSAIEGSVFNADGIGTRKKARHKHNLLRRNLGIQTDVKRHSISMHNQWLRDVPEQLSGGGRLQPAESPEMHIFKIRS